jgi:hypothetical protein
MASGAFTPDSNSSTRVGIGWENENSSAEQQSGRAVTCPQIVNQSKIRRVSASSFADVHRSRCCRLRGRRFSVESVDSLLWSQKKGSACNTHAVIYTYQLKRRFGFF